MERFALCILLLHLNLMPLWSQYDSIRTIDRYVDDFDEMIENISYRGGMGLFIPASNQHFREAPFFEFNMNVPTSQVNSVEFAIQFGGWSRENNFTYVKRLDTLKGTSNIFFNGLIKLKKDIIFFNKSFIGIGAGIGISTILIATDVIEPQNEDNQALYKGMTSFLLSPELEYIFDVTNKTQMSISFSVQYATYKLKAALQNDIGKWYYMPKITYRF
ncbi:hypothetical protein [Confluentibacter flavum]|uniref:Outer membrane protein beta-barrel domain-containing protein n=1 Tax=Confluentibacter flavum TaxID=1909700 RepID=A0A2N3HG42_9FLAO|nr:hypothetical protein [Confluentibacter flavum]PKQ43915.1 hypothetical protein CSW08_15965 [Confluentibacter flavum]